MTAQRKIKMTADQFLKLASRQTNGRYELVDGEIVAMSPERVRHAQVKAEAWLALRNAIQAAGLPCEAYTDGVTVIIDEHRAREPDASVQCKPADPDSLVLDEPMIVVEVVSPSSGYQDGGQKVFDYFSVTSIQHYLLIDPDRRHVIHYKRLEDGDDRLVTRPVSSGSIDLSPPGFSVTVEDLLGPASELA